MTVILEYIDPSIQVAGHNNQLGAGRLPLATAIQGPTVNGITYNVIISYSYITV